MTKRETQLKKEMQRKIADTCAEMVPLATRVYYTPAYHRQKAGKLPLKKLISKERILEIQRAIATGDGSDAAEKLRDLNASLEKFESRMTKRR